MLTPSNPKTLFSPNQLIAVIALSAAAALFYSSAQAGGLPSGLEFFSRGELSAVCSSMLSDAATASYEETFNASSEHRQELLKRSAQLARLSVAASINEDGVQSGRKTEIADFVRASSNVSHLAQFRFCAAYALQVSEALDYSDRLAVNNIVAKYSQKLEDARQTGVSRYSAPGSPRYPVPSLRETGEDIGVTRLPCY